MTDLLTDLRIASPCSADWNAMTGDERRRFCAQCRLHVHNLSAMTRQEAEAVLQQAGQGRVCVRFYRRADGTVLTQDCPVGLRRRLRTAWARAAALCAALLTGFSACVRGAPPHALQGKVAPVSPPPPTQPVETKGEAVMGDFASPRPDPKTRPATTQEPAPTPADEPHDR